MTEEELNKLRRELEALKVQKSATNKNVSNKNAGTHSCESQSVEPRSRENLFIKLFKSFFGNYFNFSGRASPVEYFVLVLFLTVLFNQRILPGLFSGFSAFEAVVYLFDSADYLLLINYLFNYLLMLVLITPFLSLTARRLHDGGFSGWWQILFYLLGFLGFYGIEYLLKHYLFPWLFDAGYRHYYTLLSVLYYLCDVFFLLTFTLIPSDKDPNRFGPPSDFKI